MTNMEKLLKNVAEEILTEHYELFGQFLHRWLDMDTMKCQYHEGCPVDYMRDVGNMGDSYEDCLSDTSCQECTHKWLNEEYKEG